MPHGKAKAKPEDAGDDNVDPSLEPRTFFKEEYRLSALEERKDDVDRFGPVRVPEWKGGQLTLPTGGIAICDYCRGTTPWSWIQKDLRKEGRARCSACGTTLIDRTGYMAGFRPKFRPIEGHISKEEEKKRNDRELWS